MRKRLLSIILLAAFTQAHASEGLRLDSDKRRNVEHLFLGKFLPVNEAFQASAWRNDGKVFVGFENAPGYYLHRHQFALESRDPLVSFGELEIPPGELVVHPQLGEIYVFYNQVVLSAPIVSESADTGPLAITVTFQGCSDDGLCYPPAQTELEAFAGSVPVTFASGQLPDGT
ncbi:thiol:disulfide interchange protein DsbD [Modicisalibacter xianhensis]|uniref:Thiol:disulfide interchange protein DsbD n=1 Tax=Modicisalibacter xianhensis TaxID=442341 RepID=A0A4R8FYD5_9GAMM|nr:protein-disulfide reductase DsbD N-terminal domain-containing protein [Halomonas xianhensis]TDX31660.1 thiol:disulfide interchange protein DsbD [Halomonas xianhensis]